MASKGAGKEVIVGAVDREAVVKPALSSAGAKGVCEKAPGVITDDLNVGGKRGWREVQMQQIKKEGLAQAGPFAPQAPCLPCSKPNLRLWATLDQAQPMHTHNWPSRFEDQGG